MSPMHGCEQLAKSQLRSLYWHSDSLIIAQLNVGLISISPMEMMQWSRESRPCTYFFSKVTFACLITF